MAVDLNNLPDIEFASKDISTILNDMISGYEQAYFEQTGVQKKLYPGDPIRIFLYSQALREFQLREMIDAAAKQNLLKYATGAYLDNKGAPWVERLAAAKATVTEKFTLSAAQTSIVTIPSGTRVSPGNDIYFQTIADISIPIGTTEVSATVECTTAGTAGNNYIPGQINILVDPLPWIANVANTNTSAGGTDEEDDENLRERIRLSPEGYSVAGPSGAYEFFAKQYNSLVSDVKPISPSAGVVNVYVLLNNGQIPDSTFLTGLQNYLSAKDKRPLTDNVIASAPTVVNYDVTLTYYILSDNASNAATIQANVSQAIQDYITWQKSKIGRSIDPSELNARVKVAGAKRVELTKPVYTAITDTQVAVANNPTITYGGLEDD